MTSPRLCWLLTCGSRVTSSCRQHLTCGSRVSVPLTFWTRSTVNIDQSTVNTAGSQTGFGLGRSRPGRAKHVACYDAATSWPWASTGPWSMAHAPRWTDVPVYGGPRLLPVSRVHPSPLCLWFTCTGFMHGWLLPTASLLVSLRGGVGVQLVRGKASPGHGDHDAGV